MVATRNHPRDFPPPAESPTKRTTRSSESSSSTTTTSSAPSSSPKQFSISTSTALPPTRMRPTSSLEPTHVRRKSPGWCHTPPAITVPWLAVSLPLVIWDTIYILGRPHTFAGGAIAWPMYVPYELYGRVDPVYSIDAYYNKLGWTAAQGLGNLFETLAYFAYLYILITYGRNEGKGDGLLGSLGAVGARRKIDGFWGVIASLLGYTTFMVTVAKSVLYWYNDYFMGSPIFFNNTWFNYIFVFALPNVAWILVPSYLCYVHILEIFEGLMIAAEPDRKIR